MERKTVIREVERCKDRMSTERNAIADASPVARRLFKELAAAVKAIGPFSQETKKTSIHLVRNSAFLGVHPRKQYLILTIKAEKPIQHSRVSKMEQVSKNRWHLDIKLKTFEEIDNELLGWIRQAYALCE